MSWVALAWASQQRLERPADKLILLAYANCSNEETGFAYPSIQWLCEFSGLNRKTVIQSVQRLEDAGHLKDTGRRVGATKQVKVYTVEIGEIKTVPKSGSLNSPTFSGKESQKRDTEPVREPHSPIGELNKRARATKRCPDDWRPDPSDFQVAVDEGLMPGETERALAKFRDHTFATARSDWSATFRNWIRKAAEEKNRNDTRKPTDKLQLKQDNLARSWSGAERAAAVLAARRDF